MEDISEKLNQILSDPQQMSQIMELAQQLGGTVQPSTPSAPAALPVNPEQLQKILSMLNSAGNKEDALLCALQPYLSPEKADKLRRAVTAAKLSKIITLALQEQGTP